MKQGELDLEIQQLKVKKEVKEELKELQKRISKKHIPTNIPSRAIREELQGDQKRLTR